MLYKIAAPIIQPRMRFFDANGKPLVGGKVYSFKVGTEIFKPTYRDAQRTALNQNPVVLDNEGSALIYLLGSHVLKVYDKKGNFREQIYVPETQMTTQFFDKFGKPLSFGRVWTYDIASTIKKTSFANADQSKPNPNPIILDAEGKASISMIGSYRLRTYNEKNVHLGDQDFQRPVARALTSKLYPLYFEDGIATAFSSFGGNTRTTVGSTYDEISTMLVVIEATTRNAVLQINVGVESISSSSSMLGATTRNAVLQINAGVESISSSPTMVGATQNRVVVTTTNDPENIATNLSFINAQITN